MICGRVKCRPFWKRLSSMLFSAREAVIIINMYAFIWFVLSSVSLGSSVITYLDTFPKKSTVSFDEDINHVALCNSKGAIKQSYLMNCRQYNEWEMSSCSISAVNSLYFILKLKSWPDEDRTSWKNKNKNKIHATITRLQIHDIKLRHH